MSRNNSQTNKGVLALQLNRKVHVKLFPVIARVTFRRERPDLVALLESMENNSASMAARLKAYVTNEKLWDLEADALTDKGLAVKSSGLYSMTERGLYHIWYSDNDPLLGTRPLLMQRDTAFFEPAASAWLEGSDALSSEFNVSLEQPIEVIEEAYDGQKSRQKKQVLSLVEIKPEVICSANKSAELQLSWSLGQSNSMVNIKGQLDVLDFSQKKISHRPVQLDVLINGFADNFSLMMHGIAEQFNGIWDDTKQRLAVNLEDIKQYPSAVQNFKVGSRSLHHLKTGYGQFDSVQAQHIAIKPAKQADAEQWHQNWLENFYSRAYQSSEKARLQQAQWLDHSALACFELPLKDGANLLNSLTREQQPEAFWHVAAMSDLTPSKSKKLMMPISLVNDDALNLGELIGQLTAGDMIKQMIYSDRYVHTKKQNCNLSAVAAYVNDAEGLLLTLEAQKGRGTNLPSNWQREIFKKQNDNHGRYWIFIGESHIHCWECSSGLDFICERNDGLVVAGTPGFTPKEKHELPIYLQDAIKAMHSMKVM